MDGLIAFLEVRLDEDESAARAWSTPFSNPTAADRENRAAQADPARMLREVAAKREIVRQYRESYSLMKSAPDTETWEPFRGVVSALRVFVAVLAEPYSDHPDYQEEWRPKRNGLPGSAGTAETAEPPSGDRP